MNKNNTREQKKAWQKIKRTNPRPQPLPANAVRFWEWNKAGLFHSRSNAPGAFKPTRKGWKLARKTIVARVRMAEKKSQDPKHQYKFLSRSQKMGMALRQLVGGKAQ